MVWLIVRYKNSTNVVFCCTRKATYIKELCLRVVFCLVPFLPNLRLDFDEDPMFKH